MIVRFEALEWREAPMPDGSGPVQLAALPRLSDQAFRAFVRFPPGWSRAQAGHYTVPEEFLVLEGALGLNDCTWRAGGYAWIPARRMRRNLHAVEGCLLFAWFAAPPRWISAAPVEASVLPEVRFAHWRDAPEGRLYDGPEHRTCIVDGRQLARSAASGEYYETLDLETFAWTWAGDQASSSAAKLRGVAAGTVSSSK